MCEKGFSVDRLQEVEFGVASWPEEFGNHRARVKVDTVNAGVDAVWVRIPWRLHPSPEGKSIRIVDASRGQEVRNHISVQIRREFGDIIFQPGTVPGDYYVYYMIWSTSETRPDASWLEKLNITRGPGLPADLEAFPRATVQCIEARSEFDRFDPMEVIATEEEVGQLKGRYSDRSYLIFPEDRCYPVRMKGDLPFRWVRSGPRDTFTGEAALNEFYVFQIGVYSQNYSGACPIAVGFGDLHGPEGDVIPGSLFTCFNTQGVDQAGRAFEKEWSVAPGEAGVLWCGVQIPSDIHPGDYRGQMILYPQDDTHIAITIDLNITGEILQDEGMDGPGRLSRLKWLNSRSGLEETITSPYTPLHVQGTSISCLGRQVRIGQNGFPESITASGIELLARPVRLSLHTGQNSDVWEDRMADIVSVTPAKVTWKGEACQDGVHLRVLGEMEFDGSIGFEVSLTASRTTRIEDIALEIPFIRDRVPYMAGMGRRGGKRPQNWTWHWDEQPETWKRQGCNLEYFVWLGDVSAGLYCRLKSPLSDWMNEGKGGCSVEQGGDCVLWRAFTGPREIQGGGELSLCFRLLPTPLKPQRSDRWNMRYAHAYRPVDEVMASGASIINIHHATPPNPWINYPFLNLDELVPYVKAAHRRGLKVKLYYTVRELTTRLPELWAFRSLGDEIYRYEGVGGHGRPDLDTWLREHLVVDYAPAWVCRTANGTIDAAIRTYFDSRLNNFYLEGLSWLAKNVGIDGIYLDEIGYSREMMQRVRRVLDSSRPGSLIDLHGNHDWWSCNCPIGYYMEHLPYVDTLWFGEAFDPDSPPDFWLIEMSGIPFGLSGDMLQDPNPWRGMVYGMTSRAFYTGAAPTGIWALWDSFGISDARMRGYWDPDCPVRINAGDVLATAYVKKGAALICMASWADKPVLCRPEVDWAALGMDPGKVVLEAPAISGLQQTARYRPGDEITVVDGGGCFLLVRETSSGMP